MERYRGIDTLKRVEKLEEDIFKIKQALADGGSARRMPLEDTHKAAETLVVSVQSQTPPKDKKPSAGFSGRFKRCVAIYQSSPEMRGTRQPFLGRTQFENKEKLIQDHWDSWNPGDAGLKGVLEFTFNEKGDVVGVSLVEGV